MGQTVTENGNGFIVKLTRSQATGKTESPISLIEENAFCYEACSQGQYPVLVLLATVRVGDEGLGDGAVRCVGCEV